MKRNVRIDIEEMDKRLNYWLDKVEDCYRDEVKISMNRFRKEIGIKVDEDEEDKY